jgi:hypothetical protein
MIEFLNMLGEFAIAGVIYYEIEEGRAGSFLGEIQSEKFYDERRNLYESFVDQNLPEDASLRERAAAFANLLWDKPDLRALCDQQWGTVYRLRYALRWSIFHRRMVEEWFPQVLVALWVMTNRYLREREKLRPLDSITDYGVITVRNSLRILKQRGKGTMPPITLYGKTKANRVEIPGTVLAEMLVDLDAPFN